MRIQFAGRMAVAAALVFSALGAQAAVDGSNLIVNGDAEAGTSGWAAIAGTPLFIATEYSSNWVQPGEPGPAQRGANLFVGGNNGTDFAAGSQRLDLSADAADISAGAVRYQLSGWLGGWLAQPDNALLYASFVDADRSEVGNITLGPITPDQRGNNTGLIFTQTSGLLPAATRAVVFSLSMQRLSGGDIDGYADNLSFSLAPVPEPASGALLLVGLAALGRLASRRSFGQARGESRGEPSGQARSALRG